MKIKIIPLDKKYLPEAIALLNKIFPIQDEEENVGTCFRASLDYQKYKKTLKKWKIPKLKYFLAINLENNQVLGTSGIYEIENDPHSAWVGWTAVEPQFRQHGIGKKLVSFTMQEAKKRDYQRIKLHTVDIDYQKNAHKLYESLGFKLMKREEKAEIGHDRLYYEKTL